jgi:hypothetical protein
MKTRNYLSAILGAGILALPVLSFADEKKAETQGQATQTTQVLEVETKTGDRESAAEIKNQDVAPTAKPGSASNSQAGTSYTRPSGENASTREHEVTPGVSAGGNAGSATNTGSGANTKGKE